MPSEQSADEDEHCDDEEQDADSIAVVVRNRVVRDDFVGCRLVHEHYCVINGDRIRNPDKIGREEPSRHLRYILHAKDDDEHRDADGNCRPERKHERMDSEEEIVPEQDQEGVAHVHHHRVAEALSESHLRIAEQTERYDGGNEQHAPDNCDEKFRWCPHWRIQTAVPTDAEGRNNAHGKEHERCDVEDQKISNKAVIFHGVHN